VSALSAGGSNDVTSVAATLTTLYI